MNFEFRKKIQLVAHGIKIIISHQKSSPRKLRIKKDMYILLYKFVVYTVLLICISQGYVIVNCTIKKSKRTATFKGFQYIEKTNEFDNLIKLRHP